MGSIGFPSMADYDTLADYYEVAFAPRLKSFGIMPRSNYGSDEEYIERIDAVITIRSKHALYASIAAITILIVACIIMIKAIPT